MEPPVVLEDWLSDLYTHSPTKSTLHFHHILTDTELLEVRVCSSNTLSNHAAFNFVFIRESEKHHALFEAVRVWVLKPGFDSRVYPHLSMGLLNDTLRKLRDPNDKSFAVSQIRKAIGQNYALPEYFESCMFHMGPMCLLMIHPGVIRCATTCQPDNIERLSCVFRVQSENSSDLPNFGRPQQARNYEKNKQATNIEVWPHYITSNPCELDEVLEDTTLVCVPLAENDKMRFHVTQWRGYLHDLGVQLESDRVDIENCSKYRVETLKQSIHIPSHHGRTCYGHYLASNLDLWKVIEPIVAGVCPVGVVTTCDLAVQQKSV
jgi:hypothetical protein